MRNNTELGIKLIDDIENIVSGKDTNSKRENANVKGDQPMAQMLQIGSTSSKAISNKLFNKEHLSHHENGDIHIHDLDFAPTGTTTCLQIPLDKLFKGGFDAGHGFLREPNSIGSYAALTAIAIQSNQNEQHGGQSIPALDYYLADGIKKSYKKKMKENIAKYLEIYFDLDSEASNEHSKNIVNSIGELRSIDLNKEEVDNLEFLILSELIRAGIGIEIGSEILGIAHKMVGFILSKSLKETERDTFQAMEGLIHNLNTMHSRAGAQIPFSSINFGTDISPEGRMVSRNLLLAHEAGLGKGETPIFPILIFKVKKGINANQDDPNFDLFELSCRVSSKRMFPNFAFLDAPFNLQYYKENDFNTEVAYMGCRTRTIGNINGPEIVTGRGNISFTSINLPRIAIKYMGIEDEDEKLDKFFTELDSWIDIAINQLLDRYNFQASKKQKNFPFLMNGNWIDSENLSNVSHLGDVLKHGSLAVGFIGLAETLIALTGYHHGENESSQELGLKIIGHMRKRMDEATKRHNLNFALLATPAEGLSGRFVRMDKELFGEIKGVTDKEYYTNSFHVPVYYKTSAYNKISVESPYHALTNGGHISYIEVDGNMSNNPEAFQRIIQAMGESGIGYGSINHPIDYDPICGFQGVIYDECPQCGRKESLDKIPFERKRRVSGYLSDDVAYFNDAKRAEERDRIKHA